MPFKTRKQKLSAAERRFTYSETGAVVYKSSLEKIDTIFESKPSGEKIVPTSSNSIEDTGYVKGDLLKIGLCAFVIIVGQVTLRLTLP